MALALGRVRVQLSLTFAFFVGVKESSADRGELHLGRFVAAESCEHSRILLILGFLGVWCYQIKPLAFPHQTPQQPGPDTGVTPCRRAQRVDSGKPALERFGVAAEPPLSEASFIMRPSSYRPAGMVMGAINWKDLMHAYMINYVCNVM